jgi:hypothetical protein
MSRYLLTGREQHHRLVVGWDSALMSLFAQVEDLAYESGGTDIDEEAVIGDTPEEGLLLWVVQGVDDRISDVQALVKALAPYGSIPLPIQLDLLRELDQDWPRPWQTVGAALVAICQQAPTARLRAEFEEETSYYIMLNQTGWQVRAWETLEGGDYERAFARLIYTTESDGNRLLCPEPVAGYVSDQAIIFRVHEEGFLHRLPVFTAFVRGVMLSGPVVIANESKGLSASQVRHIQEEVLFVDEAIQATVSELWYHVWATLTARREP